MKDYVDCLVYDVIGIAASLCHWVLGYTVLYGIAALKA
jgi:hypothetical protein